MIVFPKDFFFKINFRISQQRTTKAYKIPSMGRVNTGQPCYLKVQGIEKIVQVIRGERSGSVVESLTRDGRATSSSLTGVTVLRSLSKTHLSFFPGRPVPA